MTSPRPPLSVAVLGDRGRVAARRHFGETVETFSAGDVRGALRALARGRASAAVVPLESPAAGGRAGLVEALCEEGEEALPVIVGEVALASPPGPSRRFLVFAPADEARDASAAGSATRSALLLGPDAPPRAPKTLRIQLESLGAWRVHVPAAGADGGSPFLVEFDHEPGRGPSLARRVGAGLARRVLGSWRPAPAEARAAS